MGQEFEPTPSELEAIERRHQMGILFRAVEAAPATPAGDSKPADGATNTTSQAQTQTLEWTPKIPPEQYLRRFPTGPAAQRAREILAAQKQQPTPA